MVELIGAITLLLIGIIGYLLDQRNKQLNESLKELQEGLMEVKQEMQSSAQLNQFLNDRLKVVEAENVTFRHSLHALDIWIATLGKGEPARSKSRELR